jgi:amino acid permease
LLLAILIWGLAVATPDIAVVFGYEGAVLGNLLVFIIPSAFYIAAARQSQRRWFRHPLLLTSWALAGLGLVLVVASFWTITSSLVPDTSNLP